MIFIKTKYEKCYLCKIPSQMLQVAFEEPNTAFYHSQPAPSRKTQTMAVNRKDRRLRILKKTDRRNSRNEYCL